MSDLINQDASTPNEIKLSNGSYLRFDFSNGVWRIAFYERRSIKSADLANGIALAMKKPLHNSSVKEIIKYLELTDATSPVA